MCHISMCLFYMPLLIILLKYFYENTILSKYRYEGFWPTKNVKAFELEGFYPRGFDRNTFWVNSKVNRTQIGAFSLVYIFRSDHLDKLVLFNSAFWMYETVSCTVISNVQEASTAGTKLMLYIPFFECVSQDVQHSSALAVGGLSERGYYQII